MNKNEKNTESLKCHEPLVIAVDFDGVLCEDKYPKIGEPNDKMIEYCKTRKDMGDKLILWTCRKGIRLSGLDKFEKI